MPTVLRWATCIDEGGGPVSSLLIHKACRGVRGIAEPICCSAYQASKHPSAFEIAKVVSIAESTVQIAYANLKTEARTLLPPWFATPEEIMRLPDY